MAFPLIPVIAGGAALVKNLLSNKPEYKLPPRPTFFGPDYNRVLTAIKQREQARYGGATQDLRETLANQGVLGNQGALVDAFTRLSIGEGQNISEATSGLATSELGAQHAFDTTAYTAEMNKSGAEFQNQIDQRNQILQLLTGVGSGIGSLYAGSKANKENKDNAGLPNDQEYITLSDGTLMKNPNYQSDTRRILRFLFGI